MRAAKAHATINGKDVLNEAMNGIEVHQDIDQPDMAVLTLGNSANFSYSNDTKLGDAVEIKITDGEDSSTAKTIFKGEVVGIEPVFDLKSESTVVIRAFNRLHRLSRGRKSKTFTKMTDGDIVNQIAGNYSLSANVKGDVSTKYDHVYQHNQTDLEFLLHRAARINYEILVDDTTLYFRKRDTSIDSGIVLELGKDSASASIQRFAPRMSSAAMVQTVKVRAYDPTKKAVIVGTATSVDGKLGSDDGPTKAQSPFGSVSYFDVDVPVKSVEEANALAKAKLAEIGLAYITGDGVCIGNPDLKAGIVVKINCDSTRFGGKYYVVGTVHRYSHAKGGGGAGGYTTSIKVRRNAEGGGDAPDGPAAQPEDSQ